MESKFLTLFRVLFPSWKFFTGVTEIPALYYRILSEHGDAGPWLPVLKRPERKWYSVFFNPEGNLCLAVQSLFQQVEAEIGELEPEQVELFEQSVSFQLLKNLALITLRSERLLEPGISFQFKLNRIRQGDLSGSGEDFLISKAI